MNLCWDSKRNSAGNWLAQRRLACIRAKTRFVVKLEPSARNSARENLHLVIRPFHAGIQPVLAHGRYSNAPEVAELEERPATYAQNTIRVSERDAARARLRKVEIPTGSHYSIPLNKRPGVSDEAVSLPVGDEVAEQVITLPMHPYLELPQIEMIAQTFSASL